MAKIIAHLKGRHQQGVSHFAKYYKACPVCFSTWGRPHYSKRGQCEHFYDNRRRCYGSDIQWTTWDPYHDQSFVRHRKWFAEMLQDHPEQLGPRFPVPTQPSEP